MIEEFPKPPIDIPTTAQSADTVIPGTQSTIFGDYELLEEIARGGMGVVYKARQLSLDRIVAIKLVLSGTEASEEELARFRVEAQAAGRLDHPYIVPVYGYGRMEGRPFLSMGLVDGPSLSARLSTSGPLNPVDAATLLQKVGQAIEFAHRKGVVHRDLKPGNVLIDSNGDPRITDFGLAKRQDADHGLTATGQVMGTPAYMAPEQAAGEEVGPAADIYSLGATLFAALTGRPPFEATSIPELMMKVSEDPAVPPSQLNPGIPKSLDAICLRCLAKPPQDRYPDCATFAEDLGRFLAGQAITRRHVVRSRSRILTGAVLAAVVLMSLGAAAYLLREKPVAVTQSDEAQSSPTSDGKEQKDAVPIDPLAPTEPELALLADLSQADDALFWNESKGPWDFGFPDAATQYQKAFRNYGLDPLKTSPEDWTARLDSRPESIRDAVVNGLERWEFCATVAKQNEDVIALRNLQSSLDTVEWRRTLRLLREDNSPPTLVIYLKDLDLQGLNDRQVDTLALLTLTFPAELGEAAQSVRTKLLEVRPRSYWGNVALAAGLISQGKAKPAEMANLASQAIGPLRAAQALRPKFDATSRLLADVFTLLGNKDAAKIERERAIVLKYPEASKLLEQSRQLRSAGRISDAITAADQACLMAPRMIPAAIEALKARIALNPNVEDAEGFRRLANLPPTDDEAMEAFASIYEELAPSSERAAKRRLLDPERQGRRAKAWQAVTAYRDQVGYRAFEMWGTELNGSGQDPLPAFREAVRRNPRDAATLRNFAVNLAQRNGDHAETIETAKAAIALDPNTYRGTLDLVIAVTMARGGDVAAARQVLQQAVRTSISPDDFYPSYWWQHFGQAYGLQNETVADLESAAVRLDLTRSGLNLMSRPPLLIAVGREAEAAEKIDAALAGFLPHGDNYFFRGHYATVALRCGFNAEVNNWATGRVIEDPSFHRNWMILALVVMQQGDLELARQASEKSTQLLLDGGIRFRDAVQNSEAIRGLVYLSAGDLKAASECLEPLYRTHRTEDCFRIWGWSFTGGHNGDYVRTLIALGRLDEAERLCDEQRQLRPEDGNIEWAMGLLRLARNQAVDALPHFARAAQIDPLNASIELDWAHALVRSGDPVGALPYLEKSVTMAKRGRLRGFRLVAAEAAEAALRVASDPTLEVATRDTARDKAFLWLHDELTRWIELATDGDEGELAAAAQQLPKVLACPAAQRLHEDTIRNSMNPQQRMDWDNLFPLAEDAASEAAESYSALPRDGLERHVARIKESNTKVANEVLSQGGAVTIVTPDMSWLEKRVTQVAELPKDNYKVTAVSYRDHSVDDRTLRALRDLPDLRHLFLEGTQVTDVGVRRLLRRLPTLQTLNLNRTRVTSGLLDSLAKVKVVSLRDVAIDSAELQAFANKHPEIDIIPRLTSEKVRQPVNPIDGRSSFVMYIDGASRVELPLQRDAGSPTTIEAWIRVPLEIYNVHSNPVVGFNVAADGKHRGLGILIERRNLIVGESRNVKGEGIVTPRERVDIFRCEHWTHVAVTFDGRNLAVFQQGKPMPSISFDPPADDTRLNFVIGAAPGGAWPFVGLIDEVRISDSARYNGQFVPLRRLESDANTLALYHFDEGEGEIVRDSSGHGYDGKVVGNPKWVPELEVEE